MNKRYVIRPTEIDDSADLLTMLADTPQEGSIQLTFERAPNYFYASWVGTSEPNLWLMRDTQNNNRIVGAFSLGRRDVFINGTRQSVRYGSDLRIHKDYQGGRTLFRMFKKYQELMEDDWMQTVILEENQASIDTVSSGRMILPTYYPAGRLRTNMIDLIRKKNINNGLTIRRADKSDIASMQCFFDEQAPSKQFYPCYEFNKYGSDDPYYRDIKLEDTFLAIDGGRLVGMATLWDQKRFKQTRIAAYSNGMQYIRPFYNAYVRLIGGLGLPPAGELTSYIYLHNILVDQNHPDIFDQMVSEIRKDPSVKQYDGLVFGLDVNDPLQKVANRYRKVTLFSKHFLASYGDDPSGLLDDRPLMYLEPSRL